MNTIDKIGEQNPSIPKWKIRMVFDSIFEGVLKAFHLAPYISEVKLRHIGTFKPNIGFIKKTIRRMEQNYNFFRSEFLPTSNNAEREAELYQVQIDRLKQILFTTFSSIHEQRRSNFARNSRFPLDNLENSFKEWNSVNDFSVTESVLLTTKLKKFKVLCDNRKNSSAVKTSTNKK